MLQGHTEHVLFYSDCITTIVHSVKHKEDILVIKLLKDLKGLVKCKTICGPYTTIKTILFTSYKRLYYRLSDLSMSTTFKF